MCNYMRFVWTLSDCGVRTSLCQHLSDCSVKTVNTCDKAVLIRLCQQRTNVRTQTLAFRVLRFLAGHFGRLRQGGTRSNSGPWEMWTIQWGWVVYFPSLVGESRRENGNLRISYFLFLRISFEECKGRGEDPREDPTVPEKPETGKSHFSCYQTTPKQNSKVGIFVISH